MDHLVISVVSPGADDQALDDLTSQLRLELQDGGAAEARADGVVPPGVRGVDPIAIGEFVLAVAGGAQAVREVIKVIQDWRSRNDKTTVRIKMGDRTVVITEDGVIEIDGPAEDQGEG